MLRTTELEVHIVNVNHGDCVVVVGKNDEGPTFSMVIDGGSGGKISAEILTKNIDFPIDAETSKPIIHQLVASHHDRDHLGGLVKLLREGAFVIEKAWVPVLFNPPGFPWLSFENQTTFSEDVISDAEQASTKALLQIQSLAKDALLNLEHYVSDEELIEAIQLKKAIGSFSSVEVAEKSTNSTNVDMERDAVIEVINATLPNNCLLYTSDAADE